MKLFFVILGCKPKGRLTEQHDVFFGIAEKFEDLKQNILDFWPEANGKIHADAYQEINYADGFEVYVLPRNSVENVADKLYFVNLGGYKTGEFQEFHNHLLLVGKNISEITEKAKQSYFYKSMSIKGGSSHIDDKYGVDIDDIYKIDDILPVIFKEKYSIFLKATDKLIANPQKIGYIKL